MTDARCVLHEWVVREELVSVVVSDGSAGIPILHSVDSACMVRATGLDERDRAWVTAAKRAEIAHFDATGERTLYFCEMCVIRRIDSPPKENLTGGNPLCPSCQLHHAGDCA
jgi:hypothetical protein